MKAMKYQLTISVVLFETDMEEVSKLIATIGGSKLSKKIYLIDNSHSDVLGKSIPKTSYVEYIHTGKNIGFGAGHNIAIEKVRMISKFHLVLNADVIFNAEILEELIAFMNENPEVGLLAPKTLNPDGTLQYNAKLLPTPANLIFRRFSPLEKLTRKLDYKYELRFFEFDRIVEAPFFTGCFLLINSKVFEKVSGFDDRFFMYTEDIDLVRRIHKHYKTIFYPHVSIIHAHGKGSYKNRKLLRYHIRSAISYFNKWGWFFDSQRAFINKKTLKQFFLSEE